ncbi:MAG: phosphoribosylformylglycinamidine synthase II, partial [Gemmatimonadetes bacterium]|nr:phosphoribosylformylglycinamidine synthase II [Gemmatimonadota bacterium]
LTDCLNFGNPYQPDVYYQFREAIEGIREACLALVIPVVSGNVSFYNQSPAGPVYPTPTIGMLGQVDELAATTGSRFAADGDAIVLLGPSAGGTAGSEYEKVIHDVVRGDAPALDLGVEARLQSLVLDLVRSGRVRSAHDCSEGGLAVALAESAFAPDGPFGVEIDLDGPDAGAPAARWSPGHDPGSVRAALFAEAASRVVVSCEAPAAGEILRLAHAAGVTARRLGEVGARHGRFRIGDLVDVAVDDLLELWEGAIPRLMERAMGVPETGSEPR